MKKFKIPLTAVALFLGVAGAFATNSSNIDEPQKTFAKDPATGQWVDITGQTEGVDYRCNTSEEICTSQFTNDDPDNGTPVNQVDGTYQPL